MWSARVRQPDRTLADDLIFTSALLTEGYGEPDTLLVTGRLSELAVGLDPGTGILLFDDQGNQRFTGYADELERLGSGTGSILYRSDLEDLRYRWVWPVPGANWTTGQTVAADVQTSVAETRLCYYLDKNAGPGAYHSGSIDRRIPGLTVPTSAGRGPSAKSSGRFQNLLDLCSRLAELANLRIVLTWDDGDLDVTLQDCPDLRGVTRFGDSNAGSGGMLAEDWRYKIGATKATVVLSAADGAKESRKLSLLDKTAEDESALWGRYREAFVDQRGTSDNGEIAEGMAAAYEEAAGLREISAPVVAGGMEFGTDIPVGSLVSAVLDGQLVEERVRQIVTAIGGSEGEATVKVTASIGSPDAGPAAPAQRLLAKAYARLKKLDYRMTTLERDQ